MVSVQLFIAEKKPLEKSMQPLICKSGWMKPITGGLWTSMYDIQNQSSAWNERCLKMCDDGRVFRDTLKQCWWLLCPDPTARVYTIDTPSDFRNCLALYGYDFRGRSYINFEAMAQDFDALHVTQVGYASLNKPWPYNLSLWDCESTLWFRWCFREIEQI